MVTEDAAKKPTVPACEASKVQVPSDTEVTELPDAVQTAGVLEVKVIGRPEEIEAFRTRGEAENPTSGWESQVIVWLSRFDDIFTEVEAAPTSLFPAWEAVTSQRPTMSAVTAPVDETLQTVGVVVLQVKSVSPAEEVAVN